MKGCPLSFRRPPAAPQGGPGRRFPRALQVAPLLFLPLMLAGTATAAGGEHGGPDYLDFGWRVLNFVILVGFLYWLMAGKIRAFFLERRSGIKTALAEAAAARETAQKTFAEYDLKLTKATGEIEQITALIRTQGEAEKARLIDEGRKAAEKIREDAQTRMEQEFSKASRALQIEAIRLSTEMAEELLKKNLRPEDHEAMTRDYIEKVVKRQ